jgi:raffinose/stachyose/melibiose transport system permease protein
MTLATRVWARRAPGEPRLIGCVYVLPGLATFVAFVIFPLMQTGWSSLFRWDGVTEPVWAGLQNYVDLTGDPLLAQAFIHSLILVVFYSWIPVCIALVLATFLTRVQIRGMTAFRTILFLPQIVPMVVVALAWRWIFANGGPLNTVLSAVGLGALVHPWLGDFTTGLPALGVVGSWVMYGLCLVLFIAGIQKIPRDLYDAARVDGAGIVSEFLAVTLPGLRNELVVALVITTIAGLRSFDLVYMTTHGGPGNSTIVPTFLLVNRAFTTGQVGSSAAIAVVLTGIVFMASFAIIRLGEVRAR